MADEKKKVKKDKEHDPTKYVDFEPVVEQKILSFSPEFYSEGVTYGDLMILVLEDRKEEFAEAFGQNHVTTEDTWTTLLAAIPALAGEEPDEELGEARNPLTTSQRRQRAMVMRKYRSRIAQARKRAARRRASPEKLKARAKRKAIEVFKKRFAKDKSYGDMTPSEKIAIDRRVSRIPQATLTRIAQRLLPKVRAAEAERIKNMNSGAKNESFEGVYNALENEMSTPSIVFTAESDVYDVLLGIESDGSVGGDEFIHSIDTADEIEGDFVVSLTPSGAEFLIDIVLDVAFTDISTDDSD